MKRLMIIFVTLGLFLAACTASTPQAPVPSETKSASVKVFHTPT